MRNGTADSSHKKAAWTHYFQRKSVLMRLMLWAQSRFLVPKFARAISPYIKAGDNVLEAGCGTAMSTLSVCTSLGAHPWALDISRESLEQAGQRAALYGVPLRRILADIRHLPFGAQHFDVVWNQGVMEHFDDPVHIISEMASVAKIVFVAVPRKALFRSVVQWGKARLGLAADDIFHLYTERDLVTLMSQSDRLKVKASGSFNCLLVFSWTWACGVAKEEVVLARGGLSPA